MAHPVGLGNRLTITWAQDAGGSPACTDPFLWRDTQRAFHSVFHCRNYYPGPGGDAGGHASAKKRYHFFGWVCVLISFGSPRVRPMWALSTCGGPNEIELAIRVLTD